MNEAQHITQIRLQILIYFIAFLFCVYSGKMFYIFFGIEKVETKKSTYIKKINYRSEIIDRNDNILAVSLPVISIAINPQKIIDFEYTISSLTKIFPEIDKKNLIKQLSGTEKRFVWIKRNISLKQQEMLNEAGLPGIFFEKDYTRIYPQKNLLAFVVGYTDVDQNGLSGVEKSFDNLLKEKNEKLKLTIDLRLQNILHNELSEQIKNVSAIGGSGVIADVTNGEILALVSLPDFNPHKPSLYKKEELFNRISLGVYEFGSVFKPITVASALDTKAIGINEKFDSMPPLKLGKYSINDFVTSKDRMIDPETILVKSSNIGTGRIALKMGIEKQKEYLRKFGMFEPILIGLPEKAYPLWPKTWTDLNSVTISYGHGGAVTALHLIQTIAAIVNDGQKCKLNLIINDSLPNPECEQVIRKDVSRKMRKMLRNVVVMGSGKRAEVEGYCLGGKTGTSIKIVNGRYDKTKNLSSFVGAFPMNDPKYVLFVSIDEPKGGKYETTGGAVAASIAKKIVEQMIPIFGIEDERERCFFDQ
jgi:cell division protein FtsI (penicillin-binding protein 3)